MLGGDSSFRQVSSFILRGDRDKGLATGSLSCSPKDNWWFTGAQSGVISTQNHDYVALWLRLFTCSMMGHTSHSQSPAWSPIKLMTWLD